MTNKRLCTIVLLAALALLQARLAFAGCFVPEHSTAHVTAGCCPDHAAPDGDFETAITCAARCLETSNTASERDLRLLASSESDIPSSPQIRRSALYPPSAASLRLTGGVASHRPHSRLIYVLQRLLI